MKTASGFRRSMIPLPASGFACPREHILLDRTVCELAQAAGIPKPRVRITNAPGCNAFTTGRNPSRATVTVTQGLLQRLTGKEVRAVLAHELAHIKNGDTSVRRVVVAGSGVVASHIAWAGFLAAALGWRRGRITSFVVGTAVGSIALVTAILIRRFIVQRREILADEEGARLAGDPQAVCTALESLGAQAERAPTIGGVGPCLLSMVICRQGLNSKGLLSSHPSTEERIRRLQG